MIRLTLKFILLTLSSYSVLADSVTWITIHGEAESTGPMKFEKNLTLGNLIGKKVIPLSIASTNRIQIVRSGKIYSYNLKSNPEVIIKSGDSIIVPPKSFYEGQALEQEYRFEVPTKKSLKSYQEIIKIKIKGVKSQMTPLGFEFRPTGKTLQEAWSRVIIRAGDDSIKVHCRCEPPFGDARKLLAYQIELEKKIRAICASTTE